MICPGDFVIDVLAGNFEGSAARDFGLNCYDQRMDDNGMPVEIDFSKGVRGLHHIPRGAKVFVPVSIERSVWEYFSVKAEQKGTNLSDLLTDVLRRDIEINEALK